MGESASEEIARETRADEVARQGRIREGTARVESEFDKQFTPQFFDGRRDAYMAYATPQLNDQYGKAQEQLTYALARNGVLDSSVRTGQTADLGKEYDIQKIKVASDAQDQATAARNAVEGAKGDLLLQLQATADANGAAKGAIARSAALTAQPAFNPVAAGFEGFTNALGQQAALERAAAFGAPVRPRYNTGLFTPPKNAVRVT